MSAVILQNNWKTRKYHGLTAFSIMMYLCFWYKPEERATRMAIFASSVAVAGAFGGLLATGISFLNGHARLAGWQW